MQAPSFSSFLAGVAAAQPDQYADAIRAAAARQGLSRDELTAEFERMKNYILSYYDGVTPVYSFVNAGEQVIDCVPFDQAPAVRAARDAGYDTQGPAPAPTPVSDGAQATRVSEPSGPRSGTASPPGGSPSPSSTPEDSVGAQVPPGTVALPRITLERLISLGGLDHFLRKQAGSPTASPP